jgi:hypothetical protein
VELGLERIRRVIKQLAVFIAPFLFSRYREYGSYVHY